MADVDNLSKTTIDALVENGIIDDDRNIRILTLEKIKVEKKEDEKIVVYFPIDN